jgi:cellulose synthase/poly-beta-1,6-N-acetylglucosamine synthase-like glycosyltransferase
MRVNILYVLIGLLAYVFAGYPVLLRIVCVMRRRPVVKGDIEPSLTIVIPAHNEERVIAQKLNSIIEQDYPRDRVEILVASDGSTDATNEIAEQFGDKRVTLLALPRGGKAQTLNEAAGRAANEILIITDANAILAPGCLRAIVANFNDPMVGGVSANERRTDDIAASAAGLGERLYWEYDKWLKMTESEIGSIVSASGSLYAIRRSLFVPIIDPAATDDFAISTQVVRAGYRLVFEPDAVTWEPPIGKESVEFSRRVRIVTRGLRSVYGIRELLLPWNSGFYAIQLWSHKILRRLTGILAIALFAISLSLLNHRLYRLVALGQIAFYALAVVGWAGQRHRWGRRPWFLIPYYFCLSNAAATVGLMQFARQRTVTIWEPRRDA